MVPEVVMLNMSNQNNIKRGIALKIRDFGMAAIQYRNCNLTPVLRVMRVSQMLQLMSCIQMKSWMI